MSSVTRQVASDYDASAVGYSRHWGPGLNAIAEAFLDELSLPPAGVVGDVGAGAGGLLPALQARTRARLLALDLSHGMLRLAPPSHWRVVADAQQLPVRDGVLDAVTAMFVLFHLPEPLHGLRELRRVLRQGGLCAFTTWGDDDENFGAFDVVDELLDRYGADSGRGFFSRYDELDGVEKCAASLSSAGFASVSVRAERMAYRFSVDDIIGFRTGVGFGRVRWMSIPEAKRPAVLAQLRSALERLTPDELVLRDEVVYAVGRAGGP